MPRSSQLYELIKQGEDQHLDFKQHITNPYKIARTIVAFANTDGGRIVIGVDDSGEVVGIDIGQEKYMMIRAGKKFCHPPVFIHFITVEEEKKTILIAEIEKSKQEHRALDESGEWNLFVRVKDQSVLISDVEGQHHADKHNLKPIPILLEENQGLVNYLQQNDFITLKEYMKMMNISYSIAQRSLHNLVESGVLGTALQNREAHFFLNKKNDHSILSG